LGSDQNAPSMTLFVSTGEYVRLGFKYVVDLDLSKFFDRVNHDRLMARLANRIKDKRVLKLIRSFLTSGVMIGGLEEPTKEGTPQGGPLFAVAQ